MHLESAFEFERRVIRWWHPFLLIVVLVVLYLAARQFGLREQLGRLERWVDGFGAVGPLVFVVFYAVLTVLWFPSSLLTGAAGGLFGALGGFVISLTGSMLSAAISFLIARYLMPRRFRAWVASSRSFQHLDRLVKRQGGLVVLSTRLANVLPFAFVNYGFGITAIRLRTYLLWTFLGKIPGIIVLVAGVDAVIEAIRYRHISLAQLSILLVGILTLGMAVRWIRRWLRDEAE
jgi:uncharacterized membrane protein YdjX (TVP38/TMEM64 family)